MLLLLLLLVQTAAAGWLRAPLSPAAAMGPEARRQRLGFAGSGLVAPGFGQDGTRWVGGWMDGCVDSPVQDADEKYTLREANARQSPAHPSRP